MKLKKALEHFENAEKIAQEENDAAAQQIALGMIALLRSLNLELTAIKSMIK